MTPGIYAKDTALFELVGRDALFERIATGFGFTEGPVFSRLGFLLFSDLRGEKIHKYAVPWWEGEYDERRADRVSRTVEPRERADV